MGMYSINVCIVCTEAVKLNVCRQVHKSAVNDDTTVGLAASDKSDKGSYFQDFERLVWEDSELDMEFNESIGSSRRKIKKENSRKGLSKFGNIKVSLRCVKKVIIVILKAPDAGNW